MLTQSSIDSFFRSGLQGQLNGREPTICVHLQQLLKLGAAAVDKPVKLTVELPANVHRDLLDYAAVLARETGRSVSDPAKLIAPMLDRFMAIDRAFVKARRADQLRPAGKG
jgi:hypothetical protein